jgi:hypothetical protein
MMRITDNHITDNEDALLDYLYEEGDPGERVKIAQHLQQCAPCSVAVLELQSVRGLLAEWTPPEAPLGFKVVQSDAPAPVHVPVQKGSRSLFWAQAAAAVFLFAAGMAASQLHVQYADGALTVRARAAEPVTAAVAEDAPVTHVGTDILLPPASIERVSSSSSASNTSSADDMLKRVQALIDQSESRQQRQLALRLQDVVHDFDAQRQADMRRVDQNFGQLEGQTATEVARSRELVNSLVKVSQGGTR